MDTLKLGMSHENVAIVKLVMKYSDATEKFDVAFETFVKKWQTKHKLTADGVIGPKSFATLAASAPAIGRSKITTGTPVQGLQMVIGTTPDGIFGPKSEASLIAYQAAANISTDGICGKQTWTAIFCGASAAEKSSSTVVVPEPNTSGEVNVKPVDYKQYDSKWGSKPYTSCGNKSQTIKSSACGPTSGADIVATWWDASVTPVEMCAQSLAWGTRTKSDGTSGSFFQKLADKYKASKFVTTYSLDGILNCLKDGGYVVVCFGPGSKGKSSYKKWTSGGHYCVIWKYDGTHFYINDPASAAAARAKGTYAEVKDAAKRFYCFWK